ncbi:hypothetical protein Tco_0844596 [Tanacetum coccineum]
MSVSMVRYNQNDRENYCEYMESFTRLARFVGTACLEMLQGQARHVQVETGTGPQQEKQGRHEQGPALSIGSLQEPEVVRASGVDRIEVKDSYVRIFGSVIRGLNGRNGKNDRQGQGNTNPAPA